MLKISIAAVLTLLLATPAVAQQEDAQRWTFEADELGGVPTDWFVPETLAVAFGAETVADGAHEGERAARIFRRAEGEAPFGNLMRCADVVALRGKRLRLRAAIRVTGNAQAQAWMRVDRENGETGFFDNMAGRPIRSKEWQVYEITGRIDDDAANVCYGFVLLKGDEAFVDDVTLDVLAPPDAPAPARALSKRGLANLTAFARLYGYLRYFHPSDEAEEADWDQIAFAGVEAVEAADGPAALAAALESALSSAAEDETVDDFLETLQRLVAALHDGHGNVWRTGDVKATLPFAWDEVENQLVITHVPETCVPKSPCMAAGSVVVSIDGVPAAKALAQASELISGATPQWIRWSALGALAAGPWNGEVVLELRAKGGRKEKLTFVRNASFGEVTEPRPEKVAELEPGIFYVDLGRITDNDFEEALPKLAEARGILFDLRGYPGSVTTVVLAHLIDEPIECARWNVPVVTLPDREGWTFDESRWSVQPKAPRLKAKAAFLTDGRAISYAETYLGMVEHYKLAEIVGGPTAGTNGNVNPFLLPGSYRVSWTGMKVLKHDGSRHHGVGILPTVPVARTLAGVAAGRDEVLERGLEVVRATGR